MKTPTSYCIAVFEVVWLCASTTNTDRYCIHSALGLEVVLFYRCSYHKDEFFKEVYVLECFIVHFDHFQF